VIARRNFLLALAGGLATCIAARETSTPGITVGDGYRADKPITIAGVTPDMRLDSVDVRDLIERLDVRMRDGSRLEVCR